MFHRQHVESLYAISSECPSFVQAVILLKTWARQRGLFDSNAQQKQDKTKTSTKNNKKSNKRQKTGKQGKKSGAAGTTNILTLGYVLNGFTLTMILAHLMSVRKVNKQMSSYQMFKVALQFLAEGHLTSSKGGVQMLTTSSGKGDSDDEDRASSTASAYVSSLSMTSYTRAFDNVLIDPFGLNILFRLSEAAMSSAVHEAKLSLKCLDDSLRDGFTPLFMTPIDTTLKYDVYLNITLSALSPSASPTTSDLPPPSSQTPFIYPKYPTMDERSALCRQVYSVLKQGLNNRVRLISSSLTSTATKQNNTITMQVGLLLDPNHAFRPIEMGPAADDDKRAKKFRAFWGEKAELRRFRDGQIVEAAVFTTAPHMKHTIVHMISEYLLRRHITHKTVEKVAFIGNQLDSVLQLNKSAFSNAAAHSLSPNNIAPYLTNPNTAVPLIESSFKVLVARIRSLASVPLSITSILPSHSSTYFSAPFPPFPVPHSSSSSPSSSSSTDPEYSLQRETPSSTSGTQDFSQALTPIDVVLTFETSNLWPDDLVAISRIKSAFLIKIATALTDKFNDISTSTGLDFIDVVVTQNASSSTPSRFAFRVRIYHDREIMIRRQDKRLGNPSPTIPYTMSDISEMERVLVNRPIHASSMKGFVGRHPLFSNACRLVKRWLASHMLLACFEEEAVELMVAHCFTQSLPYSKPSSSLQGLCRFLHLLSSFDFYSSPLVVDLAHVADVAVDDAEKQGVQKMDDEAIEEMAHNDVTAKVYNDIMAAFDSARANGSGAPLYIATHRDIKSQHWTSASKPSQNEFARAIKFAKSSLKHISSLVTSSLSSSSSSSLTASVFKTAFKTPLNIYDVVIRVDREALPFSAQHQRLFDYTESLPPLPSKRSDDDVEGMFGGDGSDNDIMQMLLNEKKEKKKKKKFKAPPTVNDVIQSNMAYMKSQNDDDDDETVALFKSKPLVGFNAVDCYINDLKLRLEDVADIYYNEFDKSIICLSWKSKYVKTLSTSASTSKGSKRMRDQSTTSTTITPIECDFTVARCVYTTPLSTSKQGEYVGINIPEIIHDIKLMGQGIVNDVVMMN